MQNFIVDLVAQKDDEVLFWTSADESTATMPMGLILQNMIEEAAKRIKMGYSADWKVTYVDTFNDKQLLDNNFKKKWVQLEMRKGNDFSLMSNSGIMSYSERKFIEALLHMIESVIAEPTMSQEWFFNEADVYDTDLFNTYN